MVVVAADAAAALAAVLRAERLADGARLAPAELRICLGFRQDDARAERNCDPVGSDRGTENCGESRALRVVDSEIIKAKQHGAKSNVCKRPQRSR